MDQSDENSLTALLTKREQVRFREVVNMSFWVTLYMHRKGSRKTQSTNDVNIESRVTYNQGSHFWGICP